MFRRRLRMLVAGRNQPRSSGERSQTEQTPAEIPSRTSVDSNLGSAPDSFPSAATAVSASWPGIANINKLVVFGDSYSATTPKFQTPHPTKSEPLGVPWPGKTSTEPGEPNWLGHLVTNYSLNPDLLIFNYAVSGSTLGDAKIQLSASGRGANSFEHHLVRNRSSYPWSSNETLFVTWFGINDIAYNLSSPAGRSVCNIDDQLVLLYELQEELYKGGARNFLLVNVPPVHNAPAWQSKSGDSMLAKGKIQEWNTKLQQVAEQFTSAHPDATVLVFSSYDCLNAVFDQPRTHGFVPGDVWRSHGSVWVDRLHLTSNVHDFIARDVYQFLESVQQTGGGQPSSR